MQIITQARQLQQETAKIKKAQKNIGFVPTMGALHAGHGSLIQRARQENDIVVVSIFVNPKQFLAGEDYEKYPRTQEADLKLCEDLGVDFVFLPNAQEFYVFEDSVHLQAPKMLSSTLEGARRIGHFDGVCEVVLRLLNLTHADYAYFGQKDAQQYLIIKRMVEDLYLDVQIVPCPIMRDNNNLALSSRNRYLSEKGYQTALQIPKTIELIKQEIQNGEKNCKQLKEKALQFLLTQNDLSVDYLEFVDFSLHNQQEVKEGQTLVLLVVVVEGVRLLDNLFI